MSRPCRLHRRDLALVPLTFLIGAAAAAYLTWPGLCSATTYASGLRQAPHRVTYHSAAFRPNDLLMEYSRFNESPLQNALFYLGTYFADAVRLSNVLAVISYGCCSVLFCLFCTALYDRRTGLLASVFFSFLPNQVGFFDDACARAWAIPLLLLCLYLLQTGRHRWFVAFLPFCALAYPTIAVLAGLTAMSYAVIALLRERQARSELLWYVLTGGTLAVVALSLKYLSPPAGIGPMTSGTTLRTMPEMYAHGITSYLPLLPPNEELLRHVDHPFVLWGGILFLAALGLKNMSWERSWSALLVASMVGYVVADLCFMRLYLPDRFTKYSMAVLLILWGSRNWALVVQRLRHRWVRLSALAAVVVAGAFLYRDQLEPGAYTVHKQQYAAVCAYVRTLPEGVLIAGHPYTMNEVPLQGRRSVLCNYVLAHPWFSEYYGEMRRRLLASLKAVYARETEPVDKLYTRYGVTHLVIDKEYLRHDRRVKPNRQPYSTYEQSLLSDSRPFVLATPPRENLLYEDSRFLVISLPLEQPTRAPSAVSSGGSE